MPQGRHSHSAVVINGRIFVMGGTTAQNPNGGEPSVLAYDPTTNTWTSATPMPTPRQAMVAGVILGVAYTAGGYCCGTTQISAANEAFTPGEVNTPGKVTGGGFIQPDGTMTPATLLIQSGINASVGDKATFGFGVQFAASDSSPTGNLRYDDHAASVTITAVSLTLLNIGDGVCGPNTHAKIRGSATVTGPSGVPSTQDFEVEVDDCGGPSSTPPDTFKITTTGPTSYMAMGPVLGGNITIHKQ